MIEQIEEIEEIDKIEGIEGFWGLPVMVELGFCSPVE